MCLSTVDQCWTLLWSRISFLRFPMIFFFVSIEETRDFSVPWSSFVDRTNTSACQGHQPGFPPLFQQEGDHPLSGNSQQRPHPQPHLHQHPHPRGGPLLHQFHTDRRGACGLHGLAAMASRWRELSPLGVTSHALGSLRIRRSATGMVMGLVRSARGGRVGMARTPLSRPSHR